MDISDVLNELSGLLTGGPRNNAGEQLDRWAQQLHVADDPAEREKILLKIRRSMSGMGGLSDFHIGNGSDQNYQRLVAELDRLISLALGDEARVREPIPNRHPTLGQARARINQRLTNT